jgi:hypothetical protein
MRNRGVRSVRLRGRVMTERVDLVPIKSRDRPSEHTLYLRFHDFGHSVIFAVSCPRRFRPGFVPEGTQGLQVSTKGSAHVLRLHPGSRLSKIIRGIVTPWFRPPMSTLVP